MNDEKDYLYQDLPSIKPRVSREERRSLQRKSPCIDCKPNGIEKAKKSAKHLYFFYLALLAIGYIAIQIHLKRTASTPISTENSRQIFVSLFRKIHVSLIEQPNRYGLSVLFRNTDSKNWDIQHINIQLNNSDSTLTNITVNQQIKQSYSLFVPLEQQIHNLNDIKIIINP